MRKVHLVPMKLGQTFVGIIHKFVPPKNEFVKSESLEDKIKFLEELEEVSAKARELRRMFAKSR